MSTTPSLPDHDRLAESLAGAGCVASVAELHGYLSGRLAMGAQLETSQWLSAVAEFGEPRTALGDTSVRLLGELLEATRAQIGDPALGFALLLPDDDTPLPERVGALSQWCQAFLTGFVLEGKAGGKGGEESFAAPVAEAVRDLAAIAQVGADDTDTGEESEREFFEISEYVRVAVLTIHVDCCVDGAAVTSAPTRH